VGHLSQTHMRRPLQGRAGTHSPIARKRRTDDTIPFLILERKKKGGDYRKMSWYVWGTKKARESKKSVKTKEETKAKRFRKAAKRKKHKKRKGDGFGVPPLGGKTLKREERGNVRKKGGGEAHENAL